MDVHIYQKTEESTRQTFEEQVKSDLSTSSVKEQLHESWGSIDFLNSFTFDSNFDEIVQFLPVYDKSKNSTNAVIFAIAKGKYVKYGIAQRGQISQLRFDPSKLNQPNKFVIAQIFIGFDKKLFNIDSDIKEILGTVNIGGTIDQASSAYNIQKTDTNEISEWVGEEHCYAMDWEENEENLHCWTEWHWEESPIEPVTIDGDYLNGGGGGPYIPNNTNPEKPCPGNPIKNPQIAPQLGNSGTNGGLFSDQYRRYSDDGSRRPHAGLDIRTYMGQNIYSMHQGVVSAVVPSRGALGNYVVIESQVGGQTISISYSHLQPDFLPKVGDEVSPGTVVGRSGDSGSLRGAKADNYAVQHIHIEAWIGDYQYISNDVDPSVKNDLSKKAPNHIDPVNVMSTKYDDDNKPINPC